jgi:hypothetical protein
VLESYDAFVTNDGTELIELLRWLAAPASEQLAFLAQSGRTPADIGGRYVTLFELDGAAWQQDYDRDGRVRSKALSLYQVNEEIWLMSGPDARLEGAPLWRPDALADPGWDRLRSFAAYALRHLERAM